MTRARAWRPGTGLALGGYTALIYASIPFTSDVALSFVRTPLGDWLFGRALLMAVLGGAGVGLGWLRRRRAPWRSYAGLALVSVVGLYALGALAPRPLERAHLPEYGLAAYLAWRAARPALGAGVGCYAAALGTAAVIGWVEEVVQGATPGRYFAWHDVGVNALGAALGLGVLASLRAAAADRDPSR